MEENFSGNMQLFMNLSGKNTSFMCLIFIVRKKLAIELDGKIHIQKEGIENVMKLPCTEVHKNEMNIIWIFQKAN